MDIYKSTIVISVIVLLLCCWAGTYKEAFITGMPLTDNEFNQGISSNITENPLPVYFKEISMDDVNILLQKAIDRPLQSKLKDRIGVPSFATPKDLEKAASSYFVNAINSLLLASENKFDVVNAHINSVNTVDEYDICALDILIHKESKHIGLIVKAQVVALSSTSEMIGIIEADVGGYISEDLLLLNPGYERQAIQGDALSVDHTIMRDAQYEDNVVKQQEYGLLKDRGIQAKNS